LLVLAVVVGQIPDIPMVDLVLLTAPQLKQVEVMRPSIATPVAWL
jgi:hypothetical protein